MSREIFPFVAAVGQENVKKALMLNVINPKIGGVLLSGEKGTAKSTLVRGLAEISGSMKIINLPLNITEDRLVGTIDIERTLKGGIRCVETGLLNDAHNNILYVDEVNLLSEHMVNCLLDTAASGINKVEREGISYSHPSRFVLVGSMNSEEGLLRSQFLDRFGLYVEVSGSKNVRERKEIIKRRLEFEKSPADFVSNWKKESEILSREIRDAKDYLCKVKITHSSMNLVAEMVNEANCAGHRAELVIIETARAMAAMERRNNIIMRDIQEAGEFALPHRKRDLPNEPQMPPEMTDEPPETEEQEQEQQQDQQEQEEESIPEQENMRDDDGGETENPMEPQTNNANDKPIVEQVDDIGRTFVVKNINLRTMDRKKRKGEGKRAKTKTDTKKGQYIRNIIPKEKIHDMAFDATLRAAAPYQRLRENNGLAVVIERDDFRDKIREKRTGSTILFVVDASGSMGAKKRMSAVKGAVVSLLTDAYQKRDKVGLIAFRKNEAETLLNITRSVDLAQKCLKDLPTGGKTPLAAGLLKGYEVLKAARRKNPDILPVLILVSDGRTNVPLDNGDAYSDALFIARKIRMEGYNTIVVDTENDFIKLGLARDIAETLGAVYYKLEDLEGDQLVEAVRTLSN